MTDVAHAHEQHDGAAPPPRPAWHRWTAPGWLRVLWVTPIFFGLGFAHPGSHPLARRLAADLDSGRAPHRRARDVRRSASSSGSAASTTGPTTRAGGARGPRTTRATARDSWRDYFRVNTDHKVIGVQYVVTTIIFFCIGGLLAMLFRAELAQPGDQYFNPQTFNVLISEHAALMIFLFVIPAFAGLGNYVIPLMLGAADMAFPRLNALSFWLLPIAGVIMLVAGMVTPGGGPSAGWTCYAPLCSHQPLGQVFFNMGVQWAGASSIMTALNFLVTIITMRAPGMTFWRMPLLVWANFTTSTARRDRDAVHRRLAVLRHVRPRHAHELLRGQRRRLRARLPAHLLVLLAPGRLHHDAARLRDHQRGHLGDEPQADLRLPADGAVA